jgi:DNA-binding beta-propeller fold protein YncE
VKRIKNFLVAVVFALVLAGSTAVPALAGTPYLAGGLLGQTNGGSPDYSGVDFNDRAAPNDDGFNSPQGVAVDTVSHRLFVSDGSNNRVLVFNLDNSNNLPDRTADYVLGQPNFSSRSSGTTQSTLSLPRHLAVDSANSRLFVADWLNSRVMVFEYSSLSNGMNASDVLGQADFTSSTGVVTQAGLNRPSALAFDSSNSRLYVGDDNNRRVMVFDVAAISNGENAVNVLGKGNFTTGGSSPISASGLFGFPRGLAVDQTGQRLFVSDSGANRVLVFDVAAIADGEAAVNVLAAPNFTTAGATTLDQSSLYSSSGLAYDSSSSKLFAASNEHRRVLVFDVASISNGENAVNVLGSSDFTSVPDIIAYSQASVHHPMQVAIGDGKLYVTQDTFTHRLTVFDVASISNGENAVDILGQTKLDGSADYTAGKQNNSRTNTNGLMLPDQVAIDEVHHRLFIADYGNNRVIIHQLDSYNKLIDDIPEYVLGQANFTTAIAAVGPSGMNSPSGVAYDPQRNWLFVADSSNYRVLAFDLATITNGEAAIYVLGQPDFTSKADDIDQNSFEYPEDLAYDPARQLLFVIDFERVLVFNVASITNGENAVNVIGQPDFTTTGPTATSASTFFFPFGMEFDKAKNWLVIGDGFENRVLIFDTATITDGMDASYVLGVGDFVTDGDGGATQSTLDLPEGMAIDEDTQRLFIKDGNQRVMVFDINSVTNGEAAVGLIGASDFTNWNEFSIGQEYIDDSGDMVYNNAGNSLYVSDYHINRVTVFNFVRLTDNLLTAAGLGEPYNFSLDTEGEQGALTFTQASGTLPNGVSLSSAGVLSGTPTQEGDFTFGVSAADNNGTAGTYTDTKTFVLSVINNDIDDDGTDNASDPDDDGDGITDVAENSGPNSGDANDDAILDSNQTEVASVANDVAGGYTTIDATASATTCDVTSFSVEGEAELPTQDSTASYPVGLNDFTVECLSPGDSADIRIVYSQEYDTSNWVYKKYNPATQTYTDMTGDVTFGTTVIGGVTVTTVTYTIIDGGQYDQDGTVNGTIVDPAGPAVLGDQTLAKTGTPTLYVSVAAVTLVITAAVVATRRSTPHYRLFRKK